MSKKQKAWHRLVSTVKMVWTGPQPCNLKNRQKHCSIIGSPEGDQKSNVYSLPGARRVNNLSAKCHSSSWDKWVIYWQEPQTWYAVVASVSDIEPQSLMVICGHGQCDDKFMWQSRNLGSAGIVSLSVSVREWTLIMGIYVNYQDCQISSHDLS